MKNIFITGCSSGIGKGLALYFLENGWQVYTVSRRQPETLMGYDNFHYAELDLKATENIAGVLHVLLEGVDEMQYIVLNAGILGQIRDMQDTPLADFRELMEVNVWANKVILDTVFAKGIAVKQVIGISSGASINGNRGWSSYSMSKAGLNMLLKLYAAEVEGTHFTAFAPGLVDTAMQDYLCVEVDDTKFGSAVRLKAARNTPAMPKPEEAGRKLAEAFPRLLDYPNGDFVDVRKM